LDHNSLFSLSVVGTKDELGGDPSLSPHSASIAPPILLNQPPAREDLAIPVLFFISSQIGLHRS